MSEARLSMGVSAAGASKPAQPKHFSVITRSGEVKHVDFNAVTARLEPLGEGLNHNFVSIDKVAQKTIIGITDGMPTSEIDELASRVAADMATQHPDYNLLAGRVSASNLQKTCPSSFVEAARKLHAGDILADDLYEFILANANVINASIEHANDMVFDVFAMKTMARSYLLRVDKVLVETPQYM
ncbi:Ribonucleoside-diphosphate reductase large subunit, partial [Hondaea fermentalgiana]